VSENFGKLRNIILNTQEDMIKYMVDTRATEYISRKFQKKFEWMLAATGRTQGTSNTRVLPRLRYLDILVYITLQFIMGQAV
jgi:hypothetical protein